MSDDPLLQAEGPWLHLLVATDSLAYDFARAQAVAAPVDVVSRVIRGAKARTFATLFDECAAALQFPPYFGENWNAFDECLADLEWLPGDAYLVLITDAVHVLEEEPLGEFRDFVVLLERVAGEWALQPPDGRAATPFHVVLHARAEDEPALRRRLQASGVAFDDLSE